MVKLILELWFSVLWLITTVSHHPEVNRNPLIHSWIIFTLLKALERPVHHWRTESQYSWQVISLVHWTRQRPIPVTQWSQIDSCCNKILFSDMVEGSKTMPQSFVENSVILIFIPRDMIIVLEQRSQHRHPKGPLLQHDSMWDHELGGLLLMLSLPMPGRGWGGKVFQSELCVRLLFILLWEVLPLIVLCLMKTGSPLSISHHCQCPWIQLPLVYSL